MKIGFVLDDTLDSTDGVQQYVLTLGSWFSGKGHEVHYLTGHTSRNDIENIHSLSRNMNVTFNKNRMSTPLPADTFKIRQLVKRHEFDVLHVQMPHSPLLAGKVVAVAHSQGIPVIGTFHILPATRLSRLGARVLAKLQTANLKKFDQVLAVSGPAKDFAQTLYDREVAIVPNPVQADKFRSKTVREAKAKKQIVFLGRLVERKGCLELLQAVKLLKTQRQIDDIEISICGDGPMKKQLEEYVKSHGLNRFVTFHGKVSETEKAAHLQSATIAVFPSTGGESFGIVLLEAMAAGSEVVLAGDNPGYRWVMDNNEQQLISVRDTEAFAAKLHHFLSSSAARKKAGSWQKKQLQQFTVEQVGGQLLAVYGSMINNKQ